MTDKVLNRFKSDIESLSLSPFSDGRFEVYLGDRKVWSKLDSGEFPEESHVLEELGKGS